MDNERILSLIRYHFNNEDDEFKKESYKIAEELYKNGEHELSNYIVGLVTGINTFDTQGNVISKIPLFKKPDYTPTKILLPESVADNVAGIINSIKNKTDLSKFLFTGSPGTGKTSTAINIANILHREILVINIPNLIDSKLGGTAKNINDLFLYINNIVEPEKKIILFDEIDSLVLDRVNSNDVREMGRATSTFLNCLDELNNNIVIIATTNLHESLDKAIIRRFDCVVNFDSYSKEDISEISYDILLKYLSKYKENNQVYNKLFNKLIDLPEFNFSPSEIDSYLKKSIAFSKKENKYDYLNILYKTIFSFNSKEDEMKQIKYLYDNGFSLRDLEIITRYSKSKISRDLSVEKVANE